MKTFGLGLLALLAAGFTGSAMAATTAALTVTINVSPYAELTVTDPSIVLNLVDATDKASGMGEGGDPADLAVQTNYPLNIEITAGATMTTSQGYVMALTTGTGGATLGAWPQAKIAAGTTPPVWNPSGTVYYWDPVTKKVRIPSSVVVAGVHSLVVGVSSQMNRTTSGAWAAPGAYTGSLTVSLIP